RLAAEQRLPRGIGRARAELAHEERVQLGDEAAQLVPEPPRGAVLEEREEELVAGPERLVLEPLHEPEPRRGRLGCGCGGGVADDAAAVRAGLERGALA